MSQYILVENGKVLLIQTLRSLTQAEWDSPLEQSRMDTFEKAIEKLYDIANSMLERWIQQRRRPDVGVQHVSEDSEDACGQSESTSD